MKDFLIGFIGLILVLLLFGVMILIIKYPFYRIDKSNCEKAGGTYILELNSIVSKCHFETEANNGNSSN